jgi:hypothetical protein
MELDCGACKTPQAMQATKVPRFGGFIRFIAYLIVMPSIIGVVVAGLMFFSTAQVYQQQLATATDEASRMGTKRRSGDRIPVFARDGRGVSYHWPRWLALADEPESIQVRTVRIRY